MDYLAFILFGVGILLIVAGYFFNQEKKNQGYSFNTGPMANSMGQVPPQQPVAAPPQQTEPVQNPGHTTPAYQPPPQASAPQPYIPRVSMPEPKTAPAPQPEYQVDVHVRKDNPKLFQKSAYLYTDSGQNNYTGTEKVFQFQDVVGIRRFGQGVFSYDGFCFNFEHPSGSERYELQKIDHIAFYPNCVVLVLKSGLPSALLFVDETDSLRRILETFKVDG